MYTRNFKSLTSIFKASRNQLLIYLPYVVAVYIAYEEFEMEYLDIKMSIATVLGFAVALLLSFRTAASYDRWWEARKIWGGIVNDSRTLIRQMTGYMGRSPMDASIAKMAHYQVAWCKALKDSLRGLDPTRDLKGHLSEEELQSLKGKSNAHNLILKMQEALLFQLKQEGKIDSYQQVSMDHTLKNLCDHMGKCERINNTVFPTQYRSYTHMGIVIFIFMLPYGMLFSMGPFVILICMIVAFFFAMLERIAYYLQDPFMNRGSDIPMSALTRTIEINLMELVEVETDLQPMKPDQNGVLM